MRILVAICVLSAFFSPASCWRVESIYSGSTLTEASFWMDAQLFFIDAVTQKLCSYHARTGYVCCAHIGKGIISFAVPVRNHLDKFVVGSGTDILLVKWKSNSNDNSPTIEILMSMDRFIYNRFNYGAVDPAGNLWFGTLNNYIPGNELGNIFSLNENLILSRKIPPINLSSGFVWDLNVEPPKFYFNDAQTLRVISYPYNVQLGTIYHGRKEVIIDFQTNGVHTLPGRMAIDTRGWLWVPLFEGSRVIEIDPHTKRVFRSINIPAARVGACIFGGPRLNILYVSTIGHGYLNPVEARPEHDMGGHIFAVHDLGVQGWPTRQYRLNENHINLN